MFRINDKVDILMAKLAEVKEHLNGMLYIFLDEVSMLLCGNLHKIHQCLCTIMNNDQLFGGLNLIFAGDFAQLPPAFGGEHASYIVTLRVKDLLWLLIGGLRLGSHAGTGSVR